MDLGHLSESFLPVSLLKDSRSAQKRAIYLFFDPDLGPRCSSLSHFKSFLYFFFFLVSLFMEFPILCDS